VGMSKALAVEVAPRNITVNVIAPGFMVTAMTDKLNDGIKQRLLDLIPVKRMGQPAISPPRSFIWQARKPVT